MLWLVLRLGRKLRFLRGGLRITRRRTTKVRRRVLKASAVFGLDSFDDVVVGHRVALVESRLVAVVGPVVGHRNSRHLVGLGRKSLGMAHGR